MTPFEEFFTKEWPRRLASIPNEHGLFTAPALTMKDVSWDRKAAFLLWDALGRPASKKPKLEDLL